MRSLIRMCVVALLAGVTAATTVAPATAHDLDTDDFQVRLRSVSFHYEDVGRNGPSVGDTFTFSDNVFHKGERRGRLDARCDVTRRGPDAFAFQCAVTVTLRGRGQITLQGLFPFRRGVPGVTRTIAVTGGTGLYSGASGTATLVERRDEPTHLKFHLR